MLWIGNFRVNSQNNKTSTHYRVSLHSKLEKRYKDSWALHKCDKQLPHLVTPHQRHESDRGDSTVLKVEPTLLVKDWLWLCKGNYEEGWEQNLHGYMWYLIIRSSRDKNGSCAHKPTKLTRRKVILLTWIRCPTLPLCILHQHVS